MRTRILVNRTRTPWRVGVGGAGPTNFLLSRDRRATRWFSWTMASLCVWLAPRQFTQR